MLTKDELEDHGAILIEELECDHALYSIEVWRNPLDCNWWDSWAACRIVPARQHEAWADWNADQISLSSLDYLIEDLLELRHRRDDMIPETCI